MDNTLFRQEAIDRIESPERLNEMVKITNSRNWIVLFTILGIIISVIAWSIFGQLSYSIKGQGILLQLGGIQEVSAISNGKVAQTFVEPGSIVNKGDIIAYIEQPELKMKLQNETLKLNDYVNRFKKIAQFGSESLQMKQSLFEKEEIDLNKTIKTNEERIKFIADKINAQTELLEKGLITKETLYNTKNQYFNFQQANETLANDLKRIHNNMYQIKEENEIELQKIKSEILIVENSIRELKALLELNSTLYSPFNGTVIELMVNPGNVVYIGSPIISLEPSETSNNKLEAIIYINPRDGKKIKVGMKAKIYPSTIEVEEYGYIIGEVKKVSEYPATQKGMLRTLGNEELVKSFISNEPPIAITISPESDSTTFSGYKWSTLNGPKQEIRSGTICASKIIVESKRPISILIPQQAKEPFILLEKKVENYFSDGTTKYQKPESKTPLLSNSPSEIASPSNIDEKREYFTVQILATKKSIAINRMSSLYNGDIPVKEQYQNGWFKYTVGQFETKNEAKEYLKSHKFKPSSFVTKINL